MSKKFNRVTSGPSSLEIINVPAPAVATDFAYTLEEGYTYFLQALTFTYAADANAANRIMLPYIYLADKLLWVKPHTYIVTLNETIVFNLVAGGDDIDHSATFSLISLRLSNKIYLPGETRITSNTTNMQVGDQISDIFLHVQKWPILED